MSNNSSNIAKSIANLDRLVHEPARLMILTILSTVKEADFLFLKNETHLSKGNLSAHLTKLEDAGYITIKKTYRGKIPLTLCSNTEIGKKAFQDYCQLMKNFTEAV